LIGVRRASIAPTRPVAGARAPQAVFVLVAAMVAGALGWPRSRPSRGPADRDPVPVRPG
jgi:hypothetical protein